MSKTDKIKAKFKTPYNTSEKDNGISFNTPSLTKQCFKDETDINNIMRKFETTGILPENMRGPGQYGDYSELPSYQESLQVVLDAEERFMQLPAKVRKRFRNDPAELIDFCSNPANLDEMYNLGLAERPTQEPVKVGTPIGSQMPSEGQKTKPGSVPEGENTAGSQA